MDAFKKNILKLAMSNYIYKNKQTQKKPLSPLMLLIYSAFNLV